MMQNYETHLTHFVGGLSELLLRFLLRVSQKALTNKVRKVSYEKLGAHPRHQID